MYIKKTQTYYFTYKLVFIFWALHMYIFEDIVFNFERTLWCFTQATAGFLRGLNSEMYYSDSRSKQTDESSVGMATQHWN